jgi:antitoxin component HigA of HigAB toxin-antitoxin module
LGHDDQFDELLSNHRNSLLRLTQAADVGSAVESSTITICDNLHRLAGAIASLGHAEASGANAGATVEAAARAEKSRQEALSSAMEGGAAGEASYTASSSDLAAAQAFNSHSASHGQRSSMSQYDSMFGGDLVEHASAVSTETAVKAKEQKTGNRLRRSSSRAAAAAAAVATAPDSSGCTEVIMQFGSDLQRMSDLVHDQQTALDRTLYAVMRAEQRKEAELAAACDRRQAVVLSAKRGAGELEKKRQHVTSTNAKASSKPEQRAQAAASLELVQAQQRGREAAVADVTKGVKSEMTRVMHERRAFTATQLREFAALQAKQARVRCSVWSTLAQNLSIGNERTLQRCSAQVLQQESKFPSSDIFATHSASLPFSEEAKRGQALLPGAHT